MHKRDFIERLKQRRRAGICLLVALATIAVLSMMALAFLPDHLFPYWGVFLAIGMVALFLRLIWTLRKIAVKCPACGSSLDHEHDLKLAIVTDKCPYCGETIVHP